MLWWLFFLSSEGFVRNLGLQVGIRVGLLLLPLPSIFTTAFFGVLSWAFIWPPSRTLLLRLLFGSWFSSVQSLSHVHLFATPWTAARQAFLSFTNSRSLLKLMSVASVMPSNHLILCRPLLLLPSIFPSIRVFSRGSRASVVAACEFCSCYSQAQLPGGMWDLPRPAIEPASLALQGWFLTTGPSGKPLLSL